MEASVGRDPSMINDPRPGLDSRRPVHPHLGPKQVPSKPNFRGRKAHLGSSVLIFWPRQRNLWVIDTSRGDGEVRSRTVPGQISHSGVMRQVTCGGSSAMANSTLRSPIG